MTIANKPKLTKKQEMFCREYLIDLNATQAAIRAGYSKKTAKVIAYENLSKPYLQEFIQEQANKRSEKLEIDATYVLNSIKEIGERCMQSVPVLDSDGLPTGEYEFKEHGALKAMELLGKHLILFTDKVEHKHLHAGKIDHDHRYHLDTEAMKTMSKEELVKLAFDKLREWRECYNEGT